MIQLPIFDRQPLLAELIEDLPWSYDLQTGVLTFGDRFAWHAEVLGTESEETSTWLWAWANEASGIPPEQQAASLKLKALGEEHGIAEFTEAMVPWIMLTAMPSLRLQLAKGWARRTTVDLTKAVRPFC